MATDRPLGTASWTHPADVIAQHRYTNGALWLGRSPTDEATPIGFGDDRHVLLTSGNRGGKGTTFIVPNLVLWPGSVVVVDPKGENATLTAARRGPGSKYCDGMGQQVHVLDPFKTAHVPEELRSRFNPLDAIDPTHPEAIDRAAMIAAAMMVMSEGEGRSWDENARTMLRGLILHVKTAEQFEGKRNLLTVRRLLMHGDEETVNLLKTAGETDIASPHALLWESLRSSGMFRGIVSGIGATFGDMYATSPKQYWGVLEAAQRNTEFLDSEGIHECLSASNFSLSDLKTNPKGVSLYLSLPDRYRSTHSRWLRMMVDLTLSEMEATRGQPACGHRVLMCLDEFAGLDRMKSIENAVAKVAGYGVKLLFVVQSLAQLKEVYKDNWETILANCGLKLFFGVEDYFTREYVSKFIGEEEVIKTLNSASQSEGTQHGYTHTDSHQAGYSVQANWSESAQSSVTDSVQENSSVQQGSSRNNGGGRNWNLNLGFNSNKGSSWKPSFFFRDDERRSDGSGRTFGGSYGRQSNWNEGSNEATTQGRGTGRAETSGTGQNRGGGESRQVSVGSSDARNYAETATETHGRNESAHKRRLITEDELGTFFKRITDQAHPTYPGLALVLISGENPMFLRKVNYYEDHQFIRCFDPHPDHTYTPLIESTITISGPPLATILEIERDASLPFRITRWLAAPDTFLPSGAPIAEIEGAVFGPRTTRLHAPVGGWVAELPGERDGNRLPNGGFGLRNPHLVLMKNYKTPYDASTANAVISADFLSAIQTIQEEGERRHIEGLQQQFRDLTKVLQQTYDEYRVIVTNYDHNVSIMESMKIWSFRLLAWSPLIIMFRVALHEGDFETLFEILVDLWWFFGVWGAFAWGLEWAILKPRVKDREATRLRLLDQQENTTARLEDLRQQLEKVRVQLPPEQIPTLS